MKRTASCSWRDRGGRDARDSHDIRKEASTARRLRARNDDHHAHAAVEGPEHLGIVKGRFGLQPAKHRRQIERAQIDLGGEVVRKHARDVLGQAAAGDMRERLDAIVSRMACSSGWT